MNLPRGVAKPARAHKAWYDWMSYSDVGREEPVKGGYDEMEWPNDGGWDVLWGPQQRRSPLHAFGPGQSKQAYVKAAHYCWVRFRIRETNQQNPLPPLSEIGRGVYHQETCEAGGRTTCALFLARKG